MPQESYKASNNILTTDQEDLLDAYLQKLDDIQEQLKLAEKMHVAIETEHLKRILSQ